MDRSWPAHDPPAPDVALLVRCTCGLHWSVHRDLGGFRLRCECGEWMQLPGNARPQLPAPEPDPPAPQPLVRRDAHGRIVLADPHRALLPGSVPPSAHLAPGALEDLDVQSRARWTNRTVLELALVLVALVAPQIAILLLAEGRESSLLLPFASVISGALVAVIAAWSGPYGTAGLRPAGPLHFLEGTLAAGLFFAFAVGWNAIFETAAGERLGGAEWLDDLRSELGVVAALFVIAVTPAVLEEIAFRGILQGRLMALLGARQGMLLASFAFAVCHGTRPDLWLLCIAALYLGWLRERCNSLLPGMVTHFGYNALVLLAWPR